jgi:hypothetical protein
MMVTLELKPEEAGMLRFILDSYLTDLRGEIRETDNWEFRAGLIERENFIRKLLGQLPEVPETKPA